MAGRCAGSSALRALARELGPRTGPVSWARELGPSAGPVSWARQLGPSAGGVSWGARDPGRRAACRRGASGQPRGRAPVVPREPRRRRGGALDARAAPRSRLRRDARLFARGYRLAAERRGSLGTDALRARPMAREVVRLRGREAAEVFCGGRRFTRRRAMPATTGEPAARRPQRRGARRRGARAPQAHVRGPHGPGLARPHRLPVRRGVGDARRALGGGGGGARRGAPGADRHGARLDRDPAGRGRARACSPRRARR